MPTSGYLSQSLRRPLPTKDDGILRTVADAAGLPSQISAADSASTAAVSGSVGFPGGVLFEVSDDFELGRD